MTNNFEAPAEVIVALYQYRWTIEIYFRIMKQLLGCRHLLSYNAAGVEIQIYMAIIACIMILTMTRQDAHQTDVRDGLFLLHGLGLFSRAANPHQKPSREIA